MSSDMLSRPVSNARDILWMVESILLDRRRNSSRLLSCRNSRRNFVMFLPNILERRGIPVSAVAKGGFRSAVVDTQDFGG